MTRLQTCLSAKKSLWQMSLGCFVIFRRCFGYAWKKKKKSKFTLSNTFWQISDFQFPIPPPPLFPPPRCTLKQSQPVSL